MASRKRPRPTLAAELDEQLAKLDAIPLTIIDGSWSRTIREALGLPVTTLAKRMGISQPAVTKLELGEENATITLARLGAVADALDCDLVYAFVPRRSLEDQSRWLDRTQNERRRRKRRLLPPE